MGTSLERYKEAQQQFYEIALSEIRSGRKRTHWMWYIFPQIAGLGQTETSKYYAIKDLREATDFLMDDGLGVNLTNICKALLELQTNDANLIFGSPDDLKLR